MLSGCVIIVTCHDGGHGLRSQCPTHLMETCRAVHASSVAAPMPDKHHEIRISKLAGREKQRMGPKFLSTSPYGKFVVKQISCSRSANALWLAVLSCGIAQTPAKLFLVLELSLAAPTNTSVEYEERHFHLCGQMA
jgi:hypothetical protein